MSATRTAIEDAEKAGFEPSLMDASLSYSYEKRAIQHQEALNLALELERAGRQLRDNLNRLLQRLSVAEIEFIIVGGFAAMLRGSTLLTRDLDVCAVLSSANVEKLRDILRDLQPTHRLTPQRLSFLDNPAAGIPVQNLS